MKKYLFPIIILIIILAILLVLFSKQDKLPNIPLSQKIREAIVAQLAQVSETTNSMRMDFVHRGLNTEKTDEALQELYDKLENKIACLTLDSNGEILRIYPEKAVDTGQKIKSLDLKKMMQKQDPFFSDAVLIETQQTAALLGYPIWDDDNNFSGAIAAIVPINSIFNKFEQELQKLGKFWIVENDGFILYAPKKENIGENIYEAELTIKTEELLKIEPAILDVESGEAEIEDNGAQKELFWTTLNFKGQIWKFLELRE
jgi:Sec-independent protein translocase protein TatA